MALRGRCGKLDVKKSSYYVWYLGAREAKGVQAMPDAIDYLLERERLQEPFKVTLQVSSKGLKIIQTVHPGGSTRQAVKHLVPGHALLAAVQREDVVAATLLLPNPASNNPVHVHAYRCDSVETAELLGGQLKILASHSAESLAARLGVPGNNNGILGSNGINGCTNTATATATTTTTTTNGGSGSLDSRLQRGSAGNLGSDGRSTRESESSEGSGEHQTNRHLPPIQSTTIYESLAAELRAKLGRGNAAADCDAGPILLPPRDYDTMHRARGNLAGIELRRCLNQTIVGPNTTTTTTTTAATTNNNKNAAGQTTQTQTQTPVITADSNRPTLATMNTGGTGGTRSAASSGIGSDSAATPPPYQHHPHHNHHNNHHGNHHLQHHGGSSGALCPRPTRPTRDSSSDDDWGHGIEDTDYLSNHHHHHHHHEISPSTTLQHQHHQHAAVKQSVSLPRLPRSPERGNHAMIPTMKAHHLHNNHHNLQHHHHHHHHRGSPGGPAVILSNGTQLPPGSHHQGGGRLRRSLAEHRQRSPSPQYQPRHPAPSDVVSPRERFHDAKEMFRQMEREAIGTGGRNGAAAGVTATPPPPPTTTTATRVNGRNESRTLHRSEPVTRQLSHEEPLQAHPQQHQILQRQPPSRQQQFVHHHQHQSPLTQQHQLHQTPPTPGQQQLHERLIRRGAMPHHHVPPPESPIEPPLQPEISADFRPRARPQRYGAVPAMIQEREPQQEQQQSTSELSRPRPRSFYEVPMAARELRGPRNPIEAREYARGLSSLQNNNNNNNNSNGKQIPPPQPQHPAPQRPRPFTYGELSENERYPGLDRDSARSSMLDSMNSKAQVSTPARYRHSYAEPPRLGLAALHPY